MVRQTILYKGDLRCEAVHDLSGTKLITDAPVDNMGRGESFSPTDLTVTSLATCILTTMAIAARKLGAELGPGRASVEKHMSTRPPRRIAKIVCAITVSGIADKSVREKLENAAQLCPVHMSLHPDIEQAITIDWE